MSTTLTSSGMGLGSRLTVEISRIWSWMDSILICPSFRQRFRASQAKGRRRTASASIIR